MQRSIHVVLNGSIMLEAFTMNKHLHIDQQVESISPSKVTRKLTTLTQGFGGDDNPAESLL